MTDYIYICKHMYMHIYIDIYVYLIQYMSTYPCVFLGPEGKCMRSYISLSPPSLSLYRSLTLSL